MGIPLLTEARVFESAGQWDLLLPALATALLAGAVWAGARKLSHTFSVEARDARRLRSQAEKLAQQAALRLDDSGDRMHGRLGGWVVEVRRKWAPVRPGGVPSEHWEIRLLADIPGGVVGRAIPHPPEHAVPVEREGSGLRSTLPIAHADRLPQQLRWMLEVAALLHTADPLLNTRDSDIAQACAALGLRADAALPRWEGHWHDRRVLVEQVAHSGLLHVHLSLAVLLPQGLWVGGRDRLDASGDPVPLPLHSASGPLAASAAPTGVEAARELLQDTALIELLATHLADGRGSRMSGGVVALVRPSVVFTVAPQQVLRAAETVAQALEAAVERPWLHLAQSHSLEPQSARDWGLPVLKGHSAGFELDVRRVDIEGSVQVRATPVQVQLARGLHIIAGKGRGHRTQNPILDQLVTVKMLEPPAPGALTRLPAEALIPLLLEQDEAQITEAGVLVLLRDHPPLSAVAAILRDLHTLLPCLPVTSA